MDNQNRKDIGNLLGMRKDLRLLRKLALNQNNLQKSRRITPKSSQNLERKKEQNAECDEKDVKYKKKNK